MNLDIQNAENNLHSWILKNGDHGYDPYDIFSQVVWYRELYLSKNIIIRNTISRLIGILNTFFPYQLRKILGVDKSINAKGMGLLGLGFLYRYRRTKDVKDMHQVYRIADWLMNNSTTDYGGMAWGYPFDWQSRIFIPKGVPSIVVSYTVADFLFEAYSQFGEKRFIEPVIGVCEFIVHGLNRSEHEGDTICFSYTPIDNFQVHNANLFGAELLIRVGKMFQNQEYLELGERAAKFALTQQLHDGSLNYWGNDQNNEAPNKNDHYHVGFEVRMLSLIAKNLEISTYHEAADRYYRYYLDNFIYGDRIGNLPIWSPNNKYPIDVHSCAESILLNCKIYEIMSDKNSLILAGDFAKWIVQNMQNNNGSFKYQRLSIGPFKWDVTIPYLRWGQAWMFLALNYFLFISDFKSE